MLFNVSFYQHFNKTTINFNYLIKLDRNIFKKSDMICTIYQYDMPSKVENCHNSTCKNFGHNNQKSAKECHFFYLCAPKMPPSRFAAPDICPGRSPLDRALEQVFNHYLNHSLLKMLGDILKRERLIIYA